MAKIANVYKDKKTGVTTMKTPTVLSTHQLTLIYGFSKKGNTKLSLYNYGRFQIVYDIYLVVSG